MEMAIEQIISYIVVALTSLSTVIAWVASSIKTLTENKKLKQLGQQLVTEVQETKSYKELKELITQVIQENESLKIQLNETMAEMTRVKRDYRHVTESNNKKV